MRDLKSNLSKRFVPHESIKSFAILNYHNIVRITFSKQIYDVDQENIKMCKKKAKKLMEDFQIGLESN